MSTDVTVDFTIEFNSGCLKTLLTSTTSTSTTTTTDISGTVYPDGISVSPLEKLLKLYTTHTTTNMHLFDANEHLRKV